MTTLSSNATTAPTGTTAPTRAAPTDPPLDAEAFYSELTTRNNGFVDRYTQHRVSEVRVLVAGCGSTGGAAVEPLARLGVQDFCLADNGEFELNNLNRQAATVTDLDRNKADVATERILTVNPHSTVRTETSGITAQNVTRLVSGIDVVVDGVDVTTGPGWHAKYLLHRAAAQARVPVITGYDMAGTQYVRFYDYRRAGATAFDGRLTESDVRTRSSWELLIRVVPLRHVPVETIRDARAHLSDPEYSISQLVYTSMIFGALAGRIVVDLCAGGAVRRHLVYDVHNATRTDSERRTTAVLRLWELLRATREIVGLLTSR